MFLKKNIYYVRLSEDRIEVTDIRADRKISRKAILKYSNKRLLIADFFAAESEMKSTISELENGLFKRSSKMIFQPIHSHIEQYAMVEKRAFRDSCFHSGASEVFFYFGKDELSNNQIIKGLEENTFDV